ncbi:PilZ domain-containing protein, partial [bacterium]|nr:PilZ domain-containing protein [bacterium]
RSVRLLLSSGKSVTTKMVNIAEGGLAILYDAPAKIGTVLGLEFTLATKRDIRDIKTKGVIAHCHLSGVKYYIGFEFVDLNEADAAFISSFIVYKQGMVK